MKLTATTVRTLALPDGKAEAIFWDDDVAGFGVRLRGKARGYIFQYKVGDRQRRMSLGAVSALDLGKARNTAKDLYARVRLGQDPAGDKAEAKVKVSETFEAIGARFLSYQRGRLRPKTYVDVERHLLVHTKMLHGLQVAKIERRDIAALEPRRCDRQSRARDIIQIFFVGDDARDCRCQPGYRHDANPRALPRARA